MKSEPLIKEINYGKDHMLYTKHFHNDYQIIYVMDGAVQVVLNNKTFTAGKNSLIFISNLENHSVNIVETPYERYKLTISVRALENAIADARLLSVFKNRPVGFSNVFQIAPIADEITSLFQLMHAEVNRPQSEYSEKYLQNIMNLLILSVYRNNHDQFPILQDSIKSQIYDIQKYLDHHYHEEFSLKDICANFYISFSFLSRSFKELTGYSPKQYIMLHRLSYARSLIMTTDSSISDIAHMSGFSDVNNFIRHFKHQYGHTPTHFRKHYEIE